MGKTDRTIGEKLWKSRAEPAHNECGSSQEAGTALHARGTGPRMVPLSPAAMYVTATICAGSR